MALAELSGRPKLTPEEKEALLARLEARAAARDAEEERERQERKRAREERATRRWRALGIEFDDGIHDVGSDDLNTPGMDAVLRMFELLERHRPAWQRDALCQEYPDLDWFPGKGGNVDQLKAICERCLCADACKRYAVENGITDGVWGGLSGRGLRKLRSEAA